MVRDSVAAITGADSRDAVATTAAREVMRAAGRAIAVQWVEASTVAEAAVEGSMVAAGAADRVMFLETL
jgi:hypothetical protein